MVSAELSIASLNTASKSESKTPSEPISTSRPTSPLLNAPFCPLQAQLTSTRRYRKLVRKTPLILLEKILTRAGVSSKVDDSTQTVGKRYARTDECGIPYALTVDFDTLKD